MQLRHYKEWSVLSKVVLFSLAFCLACILLAICWHPFADGYTNYIYTWMNVPLAWFSSILPFSMIGFFSTWRFPILCILVLALGFLFFVLKRHRSLVLTVGIPVMYIYLILLAHSFIGSYFFDKVQYGWVFFLSFGTSTLFLVFIGCLAGRISAKTLTIWWKIFLISILIIAFVGTFLMLLPALTSTITDQNNKADVTYSQADMMTYGMSNLDALEKTYKELIDICGGPEKVVFPSYAKLEDQLIAAMKKAGETYPALRGIYPSVRFFDHTSHIFDNNIIGLFVPGTCELLIQDNLRNSSLPNTIAHEYAHLKGYLRESEADYIAAFVCINADDPWVRYSGQYQVFNRMLQVLKKLNNIADYNILVNRYNQIFNDARGQIILKPDDGTLISHIDAFTAGANEQVSADLSVIIHSSIADYAWIKEQLTINPDLSVLGFSMTVSESEDSPSSDPQIICTITSTLNGALGESVNENTLLALDQLLSTYQARFGKNTTWTVSSRVSSIFSIEENLTRFDDDYEDILMDSLVGKRLYVTLPFVYSISDFSATEALIEKLRAEANQLQQALSAIDLAEVTLNYSWDSEFNTTAPELIHIHIGIALPAQSADEQFPKLVKENLPSMHTSAFTNATFSLDHQPTKEEIQAAADKAEKDRMQASSVFDPVSYFSFASAGSDYGTSIRYLMEMYLSD